MKRRIIEAGHYYKIIGPTEYSKKGRDLLREITRSEENKFRELTGKDSYKEDVEGAIDWTEEGQLSEVEFNKLVELEKDIVSTTMLFIDDFHGYENVPKEEKEASRWEPVRGDFLCYDYKILESSLFGKAETVLSMLKVLAGKKVKHSKKGGVFFSGIKLIHGNGSPTCVLLDAALTLHKKELGFEKGLNILPYFYEDQQMKLQKVVNIVIPDFELETIFFGKPETM